VCFYHDYDYRYEVYDDETPVADKEPVTCCECHSVIPPGQEHRHIYCQQYELCQVCEEYDEDDPPEGGCEKCDYGHVESFDICQGCQKVLIAIRAVEIEAGCKGDETQPGLTQLAEAMRDDDAERYRERALRMYPDLGAHLDKLMGRE